MLTRRSLAASLLAGLAPGALPGASAQPAPRPPSNYPPALVFSQIAELSGPLARAGDAWRNGVELAVQEINAGTASGGGGLFGEGLSMLTFDAEGGRAAVQRALEPPPLALLGPLSATAARTAAPMARAGGLACITGSDAPDIIAANVVRAAPGPVLRATRLCGWLASATAARRIGVAWGTLEPGRPGHEFWARAIAAAGLEIAMDQGIPPTATSLAGQVASFTRPWIDAVLLLLPPTDLVRFLHEARRQNLRPTLVGDLPLVTASALAEAGTDAEGLRCQLDFLADPPPDQPAMAGFSARYRDAFHTEPDGPAARGYTAVGLLAAGLARLGRPDRAALAGALKDLHLAPGTPAILAETTLDATGEMIRPTFLAEIRSGRPAFVTSLG